MLDWNQWYDGVETYWLKNTLFSFVNPSIPSVKVHMVNSMRKKVRTLLASIRSTL